MYFLYGFRQAEAFILLMIYGEKAISN